jgi:molecular chaperone DnaK
VRIINEPTAAALAYGLDKAEKEQKILVFSFGGGTHDVTVMDFGKGVFQVLSTSGDTQIGGTDVDKAIMSYVMDEFKRQTGIELSGDNMAIARLKEAAEKAKMELSSTLQTDINLPYITVVNGEPKHLEIKLTRAKFEEIITPIVDRSDKPCRQALQDAKLKPQDIDHVVLVGGTTRMQIVQKKVEEIFGKKSRAWR